MTDKELLELAAKAAGINVVCFDTERNALKINGGSPSRWNPLTDDGDALRLAVKLGLSIRIAKKAGFTWVNGFEGSTPHSDNPHEATRRAITRAAAEIGKAMP